MRMYVGNLSKDVTEVDLREAFRAFGEVTEVTIVKDRTKTVSKGFGFVEMPSLEEAKSAIAGLHMREMKGRSLDVNEEKPRSDHRRAGGGGRGNRKGRGGRRSW